MMKFREGNMAGWIGVRPGHNGEQVAKSNSVSGAIAIVYTVSVLKTFFLTHFTLGYYSVGAATNVAFYIRDAGDALVYTIFGVNALAGWSKGFSGLLNPPLEIPAGYDICISTGGAAGLIQAFVHGWEEAP